MKITVVTTNYNAFALEIKRLKEESEKSGYNFSVLDLENFSFAIKDGKLDIDWLNGEISDIYILRGALHSQKLVSELLEYLRKKGAKIFDNNFLKHKYSINKVADLVKLTLAGILVPNTFFARSFDDFLKFGEEIGYPFIFKSGRAGKGRGVYKVDSREDFLKMIAGFNDEEKEAKSFLLQEYIPYKYDLRCLVIGDRTFTMRRIPKEGDFRANFSLGGSVELFDLDDKGKDLAKRALKAVDLEVGGVDILIDENDKRYVLEVNHNPGFVGMEKATGENIAKIYLDFSISRAS
jgi:RimK family alpha-L-glutamate ligase